MAIQFLGSVPGNDPTSTPLALAIAQSVQRGSEMEKARQQQEGMKKLQLLVQSMQGVPSEQRPEMISQVYQSLTDLGIPTQLANSIVKSWESSLAESDVVLEKQREASAGAAQRQQQSNAEQFLNHLKRTDPMMPALTPEQVQEAAKVYGVGPEVLAGGLRYLGYPAPAGQSAPVPAPTSKAAQPKVPFEERLLQQREADIRDRELAERGTVKPITPLSPTAEELLQQKEAEVLRQELATRSTLTNNSSPEVEPISVPSNAGFGTISPYSSPSSPHMKVKPPSGRVFTDVPQGRSPSGVAGESFMQSLLPQATRQAWTPVLVSREEDMQLRSLVRNLPTALQNSISKASTTKGKYRPSQGIIDAFITATGLPSRTSAIVVLKHMGFTDDEKAEEMQLGDADTKSPYGTDAIGGELKKLEREKKGLNKREIREGGA